MNDINAPSSGFATLLACLFVCLIVGLTSQLRIFQSFMDRATNSWVLTITIDS